MRARKKEGIAMTEHKIPAENEIAQPHKRQISPEQSGVKEITPVTRTTFWRGNYDSDPALRAEFLSACGVKK
jgi:GTP cyclohydrolase I